MGVLGRGVLERYGMAVSRKNDIVKTGKALCKTTRRDFIGTAALAPVLRSYDWPMHCPFRFVV
jgi:hypothetical protein